jgi:hypothetical protein
MRVTSMTKKQSSTKKPFDAALFDESDAIARLAVAQYMGAAGLFVQDNPDKYGPDLIVYKGFKPAYYAEVEIKRVWKADQNEFPWETVQLPSRKLKFANLGVPIEFFILREDLGMAIIIPDYVVLRSPVEEVKNKYVPEGELFVKVLISECNLVEL